jgi:Fumarase C C-terminus
MLVTALLPVIDYDKPSKIAYYAMDNDLTLKAAALKLAFLTQTEFDRVVEHFLPGQANNFYTFPAVGMASTQRKRSVSPTRCSSKLDTGWRIRWPLSC